MIGSWAVEVDPKTGAELGTFACTFYPERCLLEVVKPPWELLLKVRLYASNLDGYTVHTTCGKKYLVGGL